MNTTEISNLSDEELYLEYSSLTDALNAQDCEHQLSAHDYNVHALLLAEVRRRGMLIIPLEA